LEEILTLTSICEKGILLRSSVENRSVLNWDSPSVEVLFQLLRIALGKEEPSSLPNDVNWQEVYDLSLKQDVGAIACDGMLALKECSIDEELRYKWMGQSMVIEQKSLARWNLLCQLSDLYAQNGIKTYVLKGFSFASYYQNPFHRFSTDLDIFLLEDFEKGNQIVEKIGIKVDRNDSKHSHFTVQGIHVENHQFCVGLRGYKNIKSTERYLRSLIREDGIQLEGSKLYKPNWSFNALFFMCHARTHFLIEGGITLKHVCDWILLRDAGDKLKNLEMFWLVCDRFGLMKFAKAIDGVASYVEHGMELSDNERIMIDDILSVKAHRESHNKDEAHLLMIGQMWRNRWKFRAYSDITATRMILNYAYGYLFERKPNV